MEDLSAPPNLETLYQSGRFLDAWDTLQRLDAEARAHGRVRTLEGWLVRHLGAPGRALRATWLRYRKHPGDPHARVAAAYAVFELRGALGARDWGAKHLSDLGDDPTVIAEALEIETMALIGLRDFAAARRALDRWCERGCAPENRALSEAMLLAREHRLPEALALVRAAREEHPAHRRLVMVTATLLAARAETRDAIALLRRASDDMQCAAITQMLVALALAMDEHDVCARALEQLPALLPLAEPKILADVERLRGESLYRRGELAGALASFRRSDDPLVELLAARLESAVGPQRAKRLDVPFIAQEHLGCAPATLSALSAFFGRSADHVELADRICYHGTPAHAERAWADSHGFVTREMRLTWDAAVALLERDIPFVVSTFVPGNGHAQAVMGFDERRRALMLRDPSMPLPVEVDADAFIAESRHSGPRCLVIVPEERASALDGLELPDAAVYDALYEVERELASHQRERAVGASVRLESLAPGHRIARAARRALAAYDEDPVALLAVADEAAVEDPTNRLAQLDQLMMQQAVSSRAARLGALEEATALDGAPPIFLELFAAELATDARAHAKARRLSRRALARQHDSPRTIALLGQIAWLGGDAGRGLDLLRFAACLEPTNDVRVRQYVFAARKAGRYEEALAFVREHFDKHGLRSGEPAVLLADALTEIGDAAGAASVLEAGSRLRPDDGALLLACSHRACSEGRSADARELLERARGKVDELSWSRGAAILAAAEGATEIEQLAAWQRVADAAPLALDATASVATLLRRTRGASAAVSFLAARAKSVPHHRPTARMYLDALRGGDTSLRESALREFLVSEPTDGWAQRELALALSHAERHDDARVALDAAASVDARALDFHLTRGLLARRRKDRETARDAFRTALTIDADAPLAVASLLELAAPEERPALTGQLFEQLERGAVSGESFEAIYTAARPHVEPAWLGGALARLRSMRPELSTVWQLSIRHALIAGLPAEAADLATQAISRFPLVAEVHLEAGEAWSVSGDRERAIHHLERAVELGPQLSAALARLANALEAKGERAAVDALLERARRRAGFDATIALEAVRVRARRGDVAAGVEQVATLLEREPDLETAWEMLAHLASRDADVRSSAVAIGARIARTHPLSAVAQAAYAMLLLDGGLAGDAIAALEAAAARGLASVRLRDAKAVALALLGRVEEALAICTATDRDGEDVSAELGFRAAWIHAHGGDLPKAVAVLKGVLRERRAFVGGWQRLVEWSLALGLPAAAVEAASHLVAIAPMAASSHATLARALTAAGDRAGTKLALARTVERDPGAIDEANKLFALAVEDKDLAGASAAAAVLQQLPSAARVLSDVQLALLRGDERAARKRFRAACLDADAPEADVVAAYGLLCDAGYQSAADRVIDKALKTPGATGAVGRLWAGWRFGSNLPLASDLSQLDPSSPVGRGAAFATFDRAGTHPYRAITKRLMNGLDAWLRADDATWTAPLTAFVTQQSYAKAIWWGRSWRARPAAPASRLHILGCALHALGLRRRAMDLMRHVARRDGVSKAEAASFRAWIAFDDAVSGHIDQATKELLQIEGQPVTEVALHVAVMADVLVAVRRAPRNDRASALAKQRARLDKTLALATAFPSLRDTIRRCRWRLALDLRQPSWLLGQRLPLSVIVALMVVGSGMAKASAERPEDTSIAVVGAVLCAMLFVGGRAAVRAVVARL
jgi:tetratricopeptide (TPR) repeat protein